MQPAEYGQWGLRIADWRGPWDVAVPGVRYVCVASLWSASAVGLALGVT